MKHCTRLACISLVCVMFCLMATSSAFAAGFYFAKDSQKIALEGNKACNEKWKELMGKRNDQLKIGDFAEAAKIDGLDKLLEQNCESVYFVQPYAAASLYRLSFPTKGNNTMKSRAFSSLGLGVSLTHMKQYDDNIYTGFGFAPVFLISDPEGDGKFNSAVALTVRWLNDTINFGGGYEFGEVDEGESHWFLLLGFTTNLDLKSFTQSSTPQ